MFIKICDAKEDFCNEVITNMSLQYMIHSVSFFGYLTFESNPTLALASNSTHINITDYFLWDRVTETGNKLEDLDLKLVCFHISYASYQKEILIREWILKKWSFLEKFRVEKSSIFNRNSLFDYCKGHVRNKCAKAFRSSKF